MYLNIDTNEVISFLPENHTFQASSELASPVPNGACTGQFPLWGQEYHIAEGFLPLTDNQPEYDVRYQNVQPGNITIAEDGKSAVRDWDIISTDIAVLKSNKQMDITTLRSTKEVSGFTFGDVRYDTKPDSLQNINGMVTGLLISGEFPARFQGWIAEDNSIVEMTVPEFKQFALAARDYISTLYAVCRAKKDEIDALITIDDVLNYDTSAGW